jgi:hypothetical protein
MWNILSGNCLIVDYAGVSAKTLNSEDGRVQDLPPSAYSLFIYSSLCACINQDKEFVASEVYHVVITANIRINRMGRRLVGNTRNTRAGGGGGDKGLLSGATVQCHQRFPSKVCL